MAGLLTTPENVADARWMVGTHIHGQGEFTNQGNIDELNDAVKFQNGKSLKSYELRQKFTSVQGSPDNLGATILSEIELID